GAAASLPAAGVAREGDPGVRGLRGRRQGGRGEGGGSVARDREADRGRDRAEPVRGLAAGVRSAADAGREELLEVARLQETGRRVLQGADRRREVAARARVRDLP